MKERGLRWISTVLRAVAVFTHSSASGIGKADPWVCLPCTLCVAGTQPSCSRMLGPEWVTSSPSPSPNQERGPKDRKCYLKGSMDNVSFMIWQTWILRPISGTLGCNLAQPQFPFV